MIIRQCDAGVFIRWGTRMLVFLVVVACSGCEEQKKPLPPRPRPELQPVVTWLDRHFKQTPISGGWKVSSVGSEGDHVLIVAEIPADRASTIKRLPAEEQFRAVASAVCPTKDVQVWSMLPAGTDIRVLPTLAGQVFIEVDCGR